MELHLDNHKWTINANEYGGLLKDMYEDGYNKINMTDIPVNITLQPNLLDVLFDHKPYETLQNMDLINCFKIAYFLNIETYMECLGKEIAKRMKTSSKKEIFDMISSF